MSVKELYHHKYYLTRVDFDCIIHDRRTIMIIYMATNTVNGRCYIGQTVRTLEKRMREHFKANSLLGCSIRLYGEDKFEWTVLCEVDSTERLDEIEKMFIRKFNAHESEKGYNVSRGNNSSSRKKKPRKRKMYKGHNVGFEEGSELDKITQWLLDGNSIQC